MNRRDREILLFYALASNRWAIFEVQHWLHLRHRRSEGREEGNEGKDVVAAGQRAQLLSMEARRKGQPNM